MRIFLLFSIFFFNIIFTSAQHTFSIVAVDPVTGEIGSAGGTCLGQEDGAQAVSDIILKVGGINTQAYYTVPNQRAARKRMEAGDSPEQIVDWLKSNDNQSQGGTVNDRQYGVVDLNNGNPRAAAYTGNTNFNVKGHRVGDSYSIQGNILISADVLDDMESAFNEANGNLCDKLMASLQAAKRPGADARCLNAGVSCGSAYLRVAKPTDTSSDYGDLWLDLNAWVNSNTFSGDPIDELQRQFDEFKTTSSTSPSHTQIHIVSVEPNPTSGLIYIASNKKKIISIQVYNVLGKPVKTKNLTTQSLTTNLDLNGLSNGIYILKIENMDGTFISKKVMLQ